MRDDAAVSDEPFDVAIVGGRIAGAALAARLGEAGLRVLIVDRAAFPSRPAVSAPFVLPHTLALLDELGVDERIYAADTPKMQSFVLEFADYFRAEFRFEEPVGGRTHFYAVDRARFDHCLWRNLERCPSVEARAGARVTELVRDADGRVAGLVLQGDGEGDSGDAARVVRARAVIGADGRHSLVARAVDAEVTHRRTDVDTTIYYAHWDNVAAYGTSDPLAHIHTSCDHFSFVLMPTAEGQVMVVAQGRADTWATLDGSPDEIYASLLRARPRVWRRLAQARQVTELRGMKVIGNLFRAPGGPGWALVGDAYHQKDSIDAQGIYDALLGAKLLAGQLIAWHAGAIDWDRAIARYGEQAHAALAPMFEATMDRVKREIYDIPPPPVARTLLRWVLTHPEYGRRFTALVTRRVDPAEFLTPPMLLGLAARGAVRRLRTRLRGGPDPTAPLAI